MAQHGAMFSPPKSRPRGHAARILPKMLEVLRDELQAIPYEERGMVLDHVQDYIARRHFQRLSRKKAAA